MIVSLSYDNDKKASSSFSTKIKVEENLEKIISSLRKGIDYYVENFHGSKNFPYSRPCVLYSGEFSDVIVPELEKYYKNRVNFVPKSNSTSPKELYNSYKLNLGEKEVRYYYN